MAKRLCLFDIDGTLTKSRNVLISNSEDRAQHEGDSQKT